VFGAGRVLSKRLGWLERAAMLIPGYRGYKKRELLRDDDRRLRAYVADVLRQASQLLQQAASELTGRLGPQAMMWLQTPGNPIEALNSAAARAYNVASYIEHLEEGYSPSFDPLKVKEEELERLLEIDNAMIGYANVVLETARIILGQVRGQGYYDLRLLATIHQSLDELEKIAGERRRFLHGGATVGQPRSEA